ncbi:MAG: metal-dependent transcriptional regulator [Anaerolineales bacterium]|nr:metal-dependent transcriptional regulator [Anaerolineales bacterium]
MDCVDCRTRRCRVLAALGLFWRWRKAQTGSSQIQIEDVLKHLYTCEIETRPPTLQSIAGRLQISEDQAALVLQAALAHGLVQMTNEQLQLTPDGRAYALHILRAHRLWERYLADETGYTETKWHAKAEQYEHLLTPDATEILASRLGHPLTDPHGDPIPSASGDLPDRRGQVLTALAPGHDARIVHIEDEPAAIYAQLVAEGFYPGMFVKVLEQSQLRSNVWADNDEHVLAPIVAAAITVEPVTQFLPAIPGAASLADLKPPASGRVLGISPVAPRRAPALSGSWHPARNTGHC